MDELVVKNNLMNYAILKKVKYYFYGPIYKCILISLISFSLLLALISIFTKDIKNFIFYTFLLVFVCIIYFIQTKANLNRTIRLLKEKYGSENIYFDLIFDENEVSAIVPNGQYMDKMKYEDIKRVIETKDIVLIISKAGFTNCFEKKNINDCDLKKIQKIITSRGILWKRGHQYF
ncbi:hypothetical protein [Thomasclavelia sp.]